jgi:hypothetical protein
MNEMVERVARAIAAKSAAVRPGDRLEIDECWQDYALEARAAIEAMREPSEWMVSMGDIAMADGRGGYNDGTSRPVWQDMIDAALRDA